MPPITLTDKRRKEMRDLFVPFEGVDENGLPNKHRVVAAVLEPLVKIKEVELRYSKRMLAAMTSDNTIAGVAAVMALQREMAAAAYPGVSQPPPFNPDSRHGSSMAMRAAAVASVNAARRYISQDEYSSVFGMRRGRELQEFLDEELVKLDAEIAASEAAEASQEPAADDEPAIQAPGL